MQEERKCEFCGNKFFVKKEGSGGKTRKYCSDQCKYKAYYWRNLGKELDDDAELFRRLNQVKQHIRILSPTEAAYLAGLIDGEGSISMFRRKSGANSKYGVNYSVYMIIVNTDKNLLLRVQDMIGGGWLRVFIDPRKDRSLYGRLKPVYQLLMGAKVVRELLPQIKQYLILKEPQAKLVLEVAELIKKQQGIHHDDFFIRKMEKYTKIFREMHNKKYVHINDFLGRKVI